MSGPAALRCGFPLHCCAVLAVACELVRLCMHSLMSRIIHLLLQCNPSLLGLFLDAMSFFGTTSTFFRLQHRPILLIGSTLSVQGSH